MAPDYSKMLGRFEKKQSRQQRARRRKHRQLRLETLELRAVMTANPFTPGDLVVYRVGVGSGALASNATAVFLDEYTPSGTLVQSIAVATVANGENDPLTASGTASSEGELNLSPNGQYLALTGYDATPGTTDPSSAAASSVPRVVGIVGVNGAVDTSTALNNIDTLNNVRGAVTFDGTNIWIAGADNSTGALMYTTLGSTGANDTNLTGTALKNARDVAIFNGQLYITSDKTSTIVAAVGTGEPSTGSPTLSNLPGNGTDSAPASNSSTNSFFFAKVGSSTDYMIGGVDSGYNTLYVVDNDTHSSGSNPGLTKYSWNNTSGNWVADGTLGNKSFNFEGLTGSVNVNTVTLYATVSTGNATTGNGIVSLTDATGFGNSISSLSFSNIGSGPAANEAFRGIAFVPDDGNGTLNGFGTNSFTQGSAAIKIDSAATFVDGSNFDGGNLTISGAVANDTLNIANSATSGTAGIIFNANGVVQYGTTGSLANIGTAAIGNATTNGSNGANLVITFNALTANEASVNIVTGSEVQGLIDAITFNSSTAATTGNRTIKFQVSTNGGVDLVSANETVNVSSAASVPSINALSTLNINQGSGQQTINLSGIQHNGGAGSIAVTASSNNTSLVRNSGQGAVAVSYTSPNSTGTVTFTPVAGASGTALITVTVTDSAGSTQTTETVNVIPPPVNTVPSAQNVVENSSNVFSSTNSNTLSIADAAAGTNTVQISLSVSHGALTLSGTSGLTFSSGGNGQASFTLTGTIMNINTALNGLIYAPAANYAGSDTLQLVTNDLGHTASLNAQSTTSTVALNVLAPPPVLLNEIEANDPGTDDNRYQYVELSGTPGASLNNVYFVAFDGTAGTTGVADLVINLSGFSLGSDGLLVIQSSANTGHSIPAATTLVSDPTFFTQSGGFNNGSLSFYLYDSPNAAFTAGTDYDSTDDGTLDHLPTGAAAIDNVAVLDTNNSSDIVYGGVVVTEKANQNLGTADAVTRFSDNSSTANAAWYGGELNDTGNVDSQLAYDATRQSANEPANAVLTPGAPNYPEAPVFSPTSYSFSVQQSATTGTAVGTVSATPESGDTLSYSLSGTGHANFTISSSGAISVASGASLSGTSYSLTVTATDTSNSETATAPVTIAVLSPPVFSPSSYSFNVQKTATTGTAVGTVSATPEGSDTVSYTLSGTGSTNFAISSGGAISVANGASLSGTSYGLTVTAKDNQNNDTSTAPVTIAVFSAPVFSPTSYSFSVQQTATTGTSVGTVSATPESGDTLTYSLSGTGSTNFAISSGGTITVANGASLSGTSYSLTVTVKDTQNNDTSTAPVTVTVFSAPIFSPTSYSFNVQQTATTGTAVGTISATPESGDTLTYSLSGTGSTNFAISSSGAITVASGASLSITTNSLTATAQDNQNNDSSTAPVTITINQATPVVTVSDAGGTYSGSPFPATALVNGAGSLEGVTPTLTYYAGGTASGSPLGSVPITAGTYTVVASFAGSTDYTSATSANVTFAISQATPTVTVSDAGGSFNGTAFPATPLVNGAGSLEGVSPTVTYYAGDSATGSPLSGAPNAAGTYTVVANFAGSTDYVSAASSAVTFVISNSQIPPSISVSDAGGTFSGNSFPATATVNGGSSLEGTSLTLVYYAGSTATGSPLAGVPTAAGTYTVVTSFSGSLDYASGSENATFMISQATPTVTVSDSGGIYNGSSFAATALVAGVITGVDDTPAASLEGISSTLTYYSGSTATGSPLSGAPPTVGTYTVVASFAGSSDYAGDTSSNVTFSISQATPSVTVSDAGGTFNGRSFPATAFVNGQSSLDGITPTLTYYSGSTATGSPLSGAPSSAGTYTVVANYTGDADFGAVTSEPETFTIAQGTPGFVVFFHNGVYNGQTFAASALIENGTSLEGVFPTFTYYAGSTATGTPLSSAPSAAGTYTVVGSFPGSTDFASVSANASFTISKATPTLLVSDAGGIVNGTQTFPATATINGAGSLESITPTLEYFSGNTPSGTPLAGAPSALGTFTVQATFAGSADYNSVSASKTFTISPSGTPTFSGAASFSPTETSLHNAVVGTVTAIIANHDAVSYTLSGVDAASFAISTAGVITAKGALDFQSKSSYSFTVTAHDKTKSTAPTASENVTVSVTDAAPTITVGGTPTGQTINDNKTILPFAKVTISDAGTSDTETVTVTPNVAAQVSITSASITAAGSFATTTLNSSTGAVTISGTAANVTKAIEKLVFAPTTNYTTVGATTETIFTIVATDSSGQAAAANSSVTVKSLSIENAPTITRSSATTSVTGNDHGTVTPLANVSINDPDVLADHTTGQPLTVNVALDAAAKGTLAEGSSYSGSVIFTAVNGTPGSYQATGTTAQLTAALDALVFTPTEHRVAVGKTEKTTFKITVNDNLGSKTSIATDSKSTAVITATDDAPSITLGSGATTQTAKDDGTDSPAPFSGASISDNDNTPKLTVTVTLNNPAQGALADPTSAGLSTKFSTVKDATTHAVTGYVVTGSLTAVNAALKALVFTPTPHDVTPGSTEATTFTIGVSDRNGGSVSNAQTIVTTTGVNTAPSISGTPKSTATPPAVNDNATISPFTKVKIADPDHGATETVTVSLDNAAKGTVAENSSYAGAVSFAPVTGSTGSYSVSGTPTQVTAALEALVFTPTDHRLLPGTTENTTFTIQVADGQGGNSSDHNTVVTTKAIDTKPVLNAPATSALTTPDTTPINPFSAVIVSDPDAGATIGSAQTVTLTVKLDKAVKGTLSDSAYTGAATFTAGSGTLAGTYTISGTAADVQTALRAAVFAPTANRIPLASSGEVSTFTLSLKDSAGATATSTTVAVAVTPFEDAPTALNCAPASLKSPVNSGQTVGTFSTVDADGATDSYTYSLVTGTGDDNNADFIVGSGSKANQLLASSKLNAGTYHILTQVTDSKGHSIQKALTITVS